MEDTTASKGSPSKTQQNGMDVGSSPVGFRHNLPQMTTMTRNPKIAQSKASAKDEVVTIEKATLDVEGVGKVVHIGSDIINKTEPSPRRKKSTGSKADTNSADKNGDSVDDIVDSVGIDVVDSDTKVGDMSTDAETSVDDTDNTMDTSTTQPDSIDEAGDSDNKSKKRTSLLKQNSNENHEINKSLASPIVPVGESGNKSEQKQERPDPALKSPTLDEKKPQGKRKSLRSPPKSVAIPAKIDRSVVNSLKKESQGSVESCPSLKRQRKPKKFDIEEVETPKQKPKTPKVQTPKLESTPEMEAKYPVKWLVGDLLWAKVSGHPWWPIMVSYDPLTTFYTRISPHKTREYHVQFFGDAAERAWVGHINLMEFQGKLLFDDFVEDLYNSAKTKKDKMRLQKWYGVLPARAKAVKIGIEQAESALPLSRNERKAKFTFIYQTPKSKQKSEKDIPVSDTNNTPKTEPKPDKKTKKSEDIPPAKKRKLDEISTPEATKSKRRKVETPIPDTKKTTPVPVARPIVGTEASFDVFVQKERDTVLMEHSDFGEDELMDFCRQQWCMMSRKQKARYKSKFSDESEVSQQLSPSRKRRPSMKLLEAEQDNKAVAEALKRPAASSPEVEKKKSKLAISPAQERLKKSPKSSPVDAKKLAVCKVPGCTKQYTDPRSLRKHVKRIHGFEFFAKKKLKGDLPSPKREKTEVTEQKTPKSAAVDAKKSTPKVVKKTPNLRMSTPGETKTAKNTPKSATAMVTPKVEKDKTKTSKDSARKVKERRTSKVDAEVKSEEKAHVNSLETGTGTCTTIPAKRGRPRKSESVDSNSVTDKQSEDGQRTPSPSASLPKSSRSDSDDDCEHEIFKLSSSGAQKREILCQICEQTGELVECQGPCQGYFHPDCLGLSGTPEGTFKCDECTTGVHSCFVCKKSDTVTQRCQVAVCGKFYHIECVQTFPQAKVEGKSVTCPLHHCHTCLAGNLKASAKAERGRLLRCVRCPTAYHVGDFCIAAGSINLTGFNIVCARHFQPISTQKHHTHVNVSWCFECNKGGTLLCCESCPAAFHAECLKIEFPTGSWFCPDCVKGKRPLYGEIVWVKLGNYRWWPGEICHPRNVPLNIQEKAHQVGEFPVHFLGSHDYFWLHQGRVFSFQDGDRGSTNFSSTKGLAKSFIKGVLEATEAFKVWKKFKDNKEQIEIEKKKKKPAKFKLIKQNIPQGNVLIIKADLSEIPRCECKPEHEHPCSAESECLNVLMMYECHPAICPAGDKCQNQRFQKRLYPAQQSFKTEGRGWGLMAQEDIKKGGFVNEYVGDLIDEEECKHRIEQAHEDDVSNFYMMTLDQNRIIDAGPKGNLSRFMNNSCSPSLETQKWHVNGDVRVGLFALHDIKTGEELNFNYNLDSLGNEKTECCCGSPNCSGFIGVRPKTQVALDAERSKGDAKLNKLKKKKKVMVKRKHDDDCFRCGLGGELVMCDKVGCTKSYHLTCLGLYKPPYGKWDCPWHHCDDCGKPAVHMCVECPNSFCGTHNDGKIQTFDEKVYCLEHEDLLETLKESQSQTSTSDEHSDTNSEIDTKREIKKIIKEKVEKVKEAQRIKEESLPPKKRGPKPKVDKLSENGSPVVKTGGDSTAEKHSDTKGREPKRNNNNGGKGKGRKSSVKGANVGKGSIVDDPLAVAPMFDDSEDEEFGLVIDIPNF